jgi:putative flippase GtrA
MDTEHAGPVRMMASYWKRCPQLIQYLIVGGINTIFGYGLFCLLIFLSVHYSIAILISTVIGVLFNFQTTGRLVFQSGDMSKIGRFIGVYILTYLCNVAWLWLVVRFGYSAYVGGAMAILPIAFVGFVLNKKFVFEK